MTKSKIDLVKEKILLLKKKKLDVKASLEFLHNIAENIPVVIVTCGPSLKEIPREELIALNSKCILIAVKQAHGYLKGNEAIHLVNQFNLVKYIYSKYTYTILSSNPDVSHQPILSKVDMVLPHEEEVFKLDHKDRVHQRLAVTQNFTKYLLVNTLERPWGPGIVLELAIYMAIHLGTKDIFLVSYDLASPSNQPERFTKFYDLKKRSAHVDRFNLFLEKLIKKISNLTGISEKRIRYELGFPYNQITSSMESDENELLIKSSKDLYLWLKELGIELSICSPISYVSELIPRIKIDELSEKLSLSAKNSLDANNY